MSKHFHGNQYEDAFDSKRLQNWQLPQTYKPMPSANDGFTHIIADDRGRLLDGVPRSNDSPWGNFVGTWDMPKKIPGNVTTEMARSKPAVADINRSKKEHEAFMRQAAGSPTKQSQSPERRPGNPSPHTSQENPASKSPTQEASPKTPQCSPEDAEVAAVAAD